MSPLYIDVGGYRAVVWYTCARRLRLRKDCNRQGEIRGSHGGDRYSSFKLVSVAPSTPPQGEGCVASNLPNAAFGPNFFARSLTVAPPNRCSR